MELYWRYDHVPRVWNLVSILEAQKIVQPIQSCLSFWQLCNNRIFCCNVDLGLVNYWFNNYENVTCKLSWTAVYLHYDQYPKNIFISAVVFLELWKRKQAVIAWEWDLTKFEEDEPLRPQYEAKVKTTRYDDLPLLYLKLRNKLILTIWVF